jgi:succinoglycan biosynthesis protein ExoV
MKLTYFQGRAPNFGDELNSFMWAELLPPGFFDEDPAELFLGIGSIIFDTYPANARKYVMGSGFAGYSNAPDLND